MRVQVEVVKGRKRHAGGAGASSVCCFHVRLHLAAWYFIVKVKGKFIFFLFSLANFTSNWKILNNPQHFCQITSWNVPRPRNVDVGTKRRAHNEGSKTTRVAVEEDAFLSVENANKARNEEQSSEGLELSPQEALDSCLPP
jgi:hypothetical protein